jgi:hypothetical protein
MMEKRRNRVEPKNAKKRENEKAKKPAAPSEREDEDGQLQ